jgi:hypothetical protein
VLYVCLALAAALVVVVVAFVGLIRSMSRAAARREDLLVNQLCNLAGAPWQKAPADERVTWGEQEPPARERFTTSPEQEP